MPGIHTRSILSWSSSQPIRLFGWYGQFADGRSYGAHSNGARKRSLRAKKTSKPRASKSVLLGVMAERAIGDFQQFRSAGAHSARFVQRRQQVTSFGIGDFLLEVYTAFRKSRRCATARIHSRRIGIPGDRKS